MGKKNLAEQGKRNRNTYSGLDKHTKQKSVLVAPINQLSVQPLDWDLDLLPEHLWLEMLFHTYSEDSALRLYNEFVAKLDAYCPNGQVVYGYVSDFGLIPVDLRQKFLEENHHLVEKAFRIPVGGIMSLYPDAPCAWLVHPGVQINKDDEIKWLSECILRLLPGKDMHAGHIRVIPFNQVLKHRKFVLNDARLLSLLAKYRHACTKEEQLEVQQRVRIFMNMAMLRAVHYKDHNWPKQFWRRNFELVECVPFPLESPPGEQVKPEQGDQLQQLVLDNAQYATEHLDEIARLHVYDLYDPSRDEILLGLFSRLTRAFGMAMTTPGLWAPDMAGIMLRCMADTAITFAYLAKAGTAEDFSAFISYGEGKEKLLMLHLQDRYPKEKTLEGGTAQDIAHELGGGFMPEMINIQLADWTKKSARDLALEAGLDDIYRLVYDPASTHLHGTWMSLKRSNLVRCAQPMHRFHRIPGSFDPPLLVNVLDAFIRIYEAARIVGVEKLGFPQPSNPMKKISWIHAPAVKPSAESEKEGTS